MIFTPQQKREAYKKLPPNVKFFVMSDESEEIVTRLLSEEGLGNDDSLYNEIFNSTLGLQTLDEAIGNIAIATNKTTDDLSRLKSNLQRFIFDEMTRLSKIAEKENNSQSVKESGVVSSFEKTILNQVNAMRPIGEPERSESQNRVAPTQNNVPHNLPGVELPRVETHDSNSSNPKNAIHNYIPGGDPYREPTE